MQRSSQIPDERGDPGMDRLRDPESVRLKGEYIAAQNLAGAMFWSSPTTRALARRAARGAARQPYSMTFVTK